MLEDHEIDAAYVFDLSVFNGSLPRMKRITSAEEARQGSQSKYVLPSIYPIVKELTENTESRIAVVGIPCHILGIKKLIEHNKIDRKRVIFFGLFCDCSLNYNFLDYIQRRFCPPDKSIVRFEFRTKKNCGWPGDMRILFDDNNELFLDKRERMVVKEFFKVYRCQFCLDKLNRHSDIAFGDCYIWNMKDTRGMSNIILRTNRGKNIFLKYQMCFSVLKCRIEDIWYSQNIEDKWKHYNYVKAFITEGTALHGLSSRMKKIFEREFMHISWGRKRKYFHIRHSLRFNYYRNQIVKFLRKVTGMAAFLIAVVADFLMGTGHKKYTDNNDRKYIGIVGAGSANKGAQAMLFTVVNEIVSRYPDKKVYLLSNAYRYDSTLRKDIYTFRGYIWDFGRKIKSLNRIGNMLIKNDSEDDELRTVLTLFPDTASMIDISGYSLTSQWGVKSSIGYLLNIIISKKYSINYYIFPQSIGPFDFPWNVKWYLFPLLKIYLAYPRAVYVREEKGCKNVKRFRKNGVFYSPDIVLSRKKVEIGRIYRRVPAEREIKLLPGAVGIIPNQQVFRRGNEKCVFEYYARIIYHLGTFSRPVYVIRHAFDDSRVCYDIVERNYSSCKLFSLIDDYNAFEVERIIAQCSFIIASRYHSVIHAYRNGIPAIVLGWAEKYEELLQLFEQQRYFLACQEAGNEKAIEETVYQMIHSYKNEKNILRRNLNRIEPLDNLYDKIIEA
jgi:colanic acid/amylovoran biosynthesis protein